jgi:hypothetical protein
MRRATQHTGWEQSTGVLLLASPPCTDASRALDIQGDVRVLKTANRRAKFAMIVTLIMLVMACNLTANRVYAAPLAAGSAVVAAAEAEPGGGGLTQLQSTGPVFFSAPGYTGTLTSSVYDGDSTNPFGLTALTFTYLIVNNPNSSHEIHRLTVSSFQSFATDVSYSSLSGGLEPTFIDRNTLGDVVGFSFPTPIPPVLVSFGALAPGMTTRLMVIQTNSTRFHFSTASIINGSTTGVVSLAPDVLVPEPSTLTLGALGLLGTVAIAIRKRRRPHAA